MNKYDLEIEIIACRYTADILCRNDGYMSTKTMILVDMLRARAMELEKKSCNMIGNI